MSAADLTDEEIVALIRSRCTPCGKCMLWDGAVDDDGRPRLRLPGSRKVENARRVLLKALGKTVDGLLATVTCGNSTCLDEKHLVAWTRKRLQQRSGPKVAANVKRAARIAANMRKTNAKLTLQQVQEGRAQGLTTREAAQLWGVTQSTAHKALSGGNWKVFGGLFTGLLAAGEPRRAMT